MEQSRQLRQMILQLLIPFLQSPEKGAETSIYACTSPELDGVTGRYFKNCREKRPKSWALDDTASRRLWDVSEKLTDLPELAS